MTAQAEYDDKQLVEQAVEALATTEAAAADSLWRQFVQSVRQQFKSDERAVASELQRLAKLVEAHGTTNDAMNFKQRTCQAMLMLSMEERHKSRGSPPAKFEATTLPFANLEVLALGTPQFEQELQFYQSLKCEIIWQKEAQKRRFALLRLAAGTRTLLIEHQSFFIEPAYASLDAASTISRLKEKKVVEVENMEWPNGSAHRFKTPNGSGFILCKQM